MRNCLLIVISFILSAFGALAQSGDYDCKINMVGLSRERADIVLSLFPNAYQSLLYSIQDRFYLVLEEKDNTYECAIVEADWEYNAFDMRKLNMEDMYEFLPKSKKTRRSIRSGGDDRLAAVQVFLNEEFKPCNYPEGDCLTENSGIFDHHQGVLTYFVMVDAEGKRHGEYRLPSITSPAPIDIDLLVFLIKAVSCVFETHQ